MVTDCYNNSDNCLEQTQVIMLQVIGQTQGLQVINFFRVRILSLKLANYYTQPL